MKRFPVILAVLCFWTCALQGEEDVWIFRWGSVSNAIGGYRVTATLLNQPTNTLPALPVTWLLSTNEMLAADIERDVPVGTNELLVISLGGPMSVTNANGSVTPQFILNSPPTDPYRLVKQPKLASSWTVIKTVSELNSAWTPRGVIIFPNQTSTNLILQLSPRLEK